MPIFINRLVIYIDIILNRMGEAKRREKLGLPPRQKIKKSNETSNQNLINNFLNKYPYSPYILGFVLITVLIIDLVNYYK